jgi:hypothetical protein
MNRTPIVLAILVCLAATPAFAQPWSGFLVNSNCYDTELRNTKAGSPTQANRDKDADVRFCAPNEKTRSFAIVDQDGTSFKLDAAGNEKAAEITRQSGKKEFLKVVVTGDKNKGRIRVDSITKED